MCFSQHRCDHARLDARSCLLKHQYKSSSVLVFLGLLAPPTHSLVIVIVISGIIHLIMDATDGIRRLQKG